MLNRVPVGKLPAATALLTLLGSSAAMAQNPDVVQSIKMPPGFEWLQPLMPIIVPAIAMGSMAMLAWFLKVFFSTTISAVAVAFDTAAKVMEDNAKKTPDTGDDARASVGAAVCRVIAEKLRAGEKTLPTFGRRSDDEKH